MRFDPIVKGFPHMIHGADYNPDQWLKWKDTILPEDMRLAKLAGINSLSVGIFAWAALEPQEGEYRFEWLDEVMDLLAENGMKAVLATPSGARPAWLSQRYPEVLRVDERRVRHLHGVRHNHCMSSPVYRQKVAAINEKLAQRYKDHPALGVWHVSNEYGGECHCPLCQERFRAYVKAKYGTLDALNEAYWATFWSHTYFDWSQVESPSPIGECYTHGLTLDWKRFTTEQHADFCRAEMAPLKRVTPRVPCTVNLMGTYPGIDYFRLAQEVDVVSWDAYPQWTGDERDIEIAQRFSFLHDLTRGLKGKPFMLMESSPSATNWRPYATLHRPGVHMLQSMQAVAHGSDSVQYFQFRKGRGASEKFHGAVVDHEGSENTRVFKDVADLGARLAGLDAVVGTDTPAQIALVYDWNVRWALDDVKGLLQEKTGYESAVIAHYKSFWKMGVPVDVIDQTGDFSGYKLLVAPMSYMLRGDFAARVNAYVKAGGRFVATYATGYVNDSDLCFLGGFPGPLKDVLGIWCEEIDALTPDMRNSVIANGRAYEAFDLCELIHARTARVLAAYGQDFYAGMPALTCNDFGMGQAYYIAARTEQAFLDGFYSRLADDLGIARAVPGPLPEGVTVQVRTDGACDYLFAMNFTPRAVTIDMRGAAVTLPPHGVHIAHSPHA